MIRTTLERMCTVSKSIDSHVAVQSKLVLMKQTRFKHVHSIDSQVAHPDQGPRRPVYLFIVQPSEEI